MEVQGSEREGVLEKPQALDECRPSPLPFPIPSSSSALDERQLQLRSPLAGGSTHNRRVYLAQYQGRVVVAKEFGPTQLERGRIECAAYEKLRFAPNLLEYVGQCQRGEGLLYLVTEHAPHGTLRDMCERAVDQLEECNRAAAMRQRVQWLLDVVSALRYMHERRICHGDVNPSNVFIRSDFSAAFGDVECSRWLASDISGASTDLVTSSFVAPEVRDGFHKLNEGAADVYQFGMTVLSVFVGHASADCCLCQFSELMQWMPNYESRIALLKAIVQRCIRADPKHRPPAGELVGWFTDIVCEWDSLEEAHLHESNTPDEELALSSALGHSQGDIVDAWLGLTRPQMNESGADSFVEAIWTSSSGTPVMTSFVDSAGEEQEHNRFVVGVAEINDHELKDVLPQDNPPTQDGDNPQKHTDSELSAPTGYAVKEKGEEQYDRSIADGESILSAQTSLLQGAELAFGVEQQQIQICCEGDFDSLEFRSSMDTLEKSGLYKHMREMVNRSEWESTAESEHGNVARVASSHYRNGLYEEACKQFSECVEITRKLVGDEHPDMAAALNNLAALLSNMGRYDEAESLYRQSLAIDRKVHGDEHPEVATNLNNLAGLLRQQGKYDDAEPIYEQSLAIRRQAFGENHPDVAQSLNNLALLLNDLGRYDEAESLYRQSLEIDRKVYGEEHPEVATGLNNLAALLLEQGKNADARAPMEEAIAIWKHSLSEEHPLVATGLNNLARLLKDMGKNDEAQKLYEQSLAIRRKVYGEEHPAVATALNNLALQLRHMGKHEEARAPQELAIALWRKTLGEEHPRVATGLSNLASLLSDMGKYVEAELLCKEALEIQRLVLGDTHVDYGTSLNVLAGLLIDQGRYDEARSLREEVLRVYQHALGKAHPWVATALNNLAALLRQQGKYEEAQRFYEEAIAVWRRALGDDHEEVATGLNNLARVLMHQGKCDEAQTLYERSLAMRRKCFGDEHPDVAQSLNNLAMHLWIMGRETEAKGLGEQAVGIATRLLGENHPTSQQYRQDWS